MLLIHVSSSLRLPLAQLKGGFLHGFLHMKENYFVPGDCAAVWLAPRQYLRGFVLQKWTSKTLHGRPEH